MHLRVRPLAVLSIVTALLPYAAAQETPLASVAAPVTLPAESLPAPDWKTLAAAYNYDAAVKIEVTAETRPDDTYFVQHLSFVNRRKETVTGLFVRPKADRVYPIALVLHGLGSSKEGTIDFYGKLLAAQRESPASPLMLLCTANASQKRGPRQMASRLQG